MAFGQEIRFKIGGDASSLEKTFDRTAAKAESAGKRMDKALSSKSSLETDKARGALAKYREQSQFREANTIGKIKIVTNELSDLAAQRASYEKNTTGYYKTQLQIEERRTKLRQLQKEAQADCVGQIPLPAQAAQSSGGMASLLIRGVGAAVTFGLKSYLDWQESRARVQQAKQGAAEVGLDSYKNRFESQQGLTGVVSQGQNTESGLEMQKKMMENRVSKLSSGALGAMRFFFPEQLEEAEKELARITGELTKQKNLNQTNTRELHKQDETYESQLHYLNDAYELRERGLASESKMALFELNRANRQLEIEKKRGTPQSVQTATLEQAQAQNNYAAAQQSARFQQYTVNQQLAQQAAEGRTSPDGKPQGFSETERIAQRAQQYRERSRAAALTGAGDDAARFMAAAIRDESSVGARLSRATAKVAPLDVPDSSAIKTEISRSNEILQSIKDALVETEVGG